MKNELFNILTSLNQEELNILIQTAKPNNKLLGKTAKKLIFQPYNLVKIKLPLWLADFEVEKIIKAFFKASKKQINTLQPKETFAFIIWIKDQLQQIYTLENTYLTANPNIDLIKAGIEELEQFKELNIIDNLAQGDILKWKKIKKLPYHLVFDKLHKNTIEAKINKNYTKIIADKQIVKK